MTNNSHRATDKTESDHDKVIRLEAHWAAGQEALGYARKDIDRRLEEMNQLRAQINAERGSFMTRLEYEAKHQTLISAISSLQKFQYTVLGALTVFQLLVGVVLYLVKR